MSNLSNGIVEVLFPFFGSKISKGYTLNVVRIEQEITRRVGLIRFRLSYKLMVRNVTAIFRFSHLLWIRHLLSHNGAWLTFAQEIHGQNFLSNRHTDQLRLPSCRSCPSQTRMSRGECDVTLRPVASRWNLHVPKLVTKQQTIAQRTGAPMKCCENLL